MSITTASTTSILKKSCHNELHLLNNNAPRATLGDLNACAKTCPSLVPQAQSSAAAAAVACATSLSSGAGVGSGVVAAPAVSPTAANLSTLNQVSHICCRVFQESAGFYHDYSCVQSTLNLETRPSANNLMTFNPFVGARTASLATVGGGGAGVLHINHFNHNKVEKCVQTEINRSYKDEFLRSLAEIEGLKMKICSLAKELKSVRDKESVVWNDCSQSHKQCEENVNRIRRALESREIAVLERDFLCYEYQEQEKVYKKRLADLEVGIVLGRQNYALKSITCEKVQADAAVKTLALILERRPTGLAEYVKKFEKSHCQWSKLATELSSLSGQTLKFYTNQLRALQESHAQLLELPVLPSVSVTTEKGRDPLACLGEFLDHLSSKCAQLLNPTPAEYVQALVHRHGNMAATPVAATVPLSAGAGAITSSTITDASNSCSSLPTSSWFARPEKSHASSPTSSGGNSNYITHNVVCQKKMASRLASDVLSSQDIITVTSQNAITCGAVATLPSIVHPISALTCPLATNKALKHNILSVSPCTTGVSNCIYSPSTGQKLLSSLFASSTDHTASAGGGGAGAVSRLAHGDIAPPSLQSIAPVGVWPQFKHGANAINVAHHHPVCISSLMSSAVDKEHAAASASAAARESPLPSSLSHSTATPYHKQQCICGVCNEPVCNVLSTRPSCNHVFHPKCAIMIEKCPVCLK